jgi:site-specific recombinase XerD
MNSVTVHINNLKTTIMNNLQLEKMFAKLNKDANKNEESNHIICHSMAIALWNNFNKKQREQILIELKDIENTQIFF